MTLVNITRVNGGAGVQSLPIALADMNTLLGHHRDPFDRLLVAQALNHELIVISADKNLKGYGAKIVW